MALIGTGTYAQNTWQTLFATGPPSPGSAGVPLPDGSRLVVELALVTSTNWDNSPAVVWVDVSAAVTNLTFLTGDTAGRLSRWPIEQFVITTADLTATLGDFVADGYPGNGPAPGMFARWGIVTPAGVWTPRQSGLVYTIEDRAAGRVRGLVFKCYGTLLYWAGLTNYAHTYAGGENINTAMAAVCSDTSDAPWPWAQTFAAQSASFPTTISAAAIGGGPFPKLQLMHRMADTQAMRLFNTPYGGLATELWTAAAASGFRISDEPAVTVAGHATVAGTIQAIDSKWVSSQDRTVGVLRLPGAPSGAANSSAYTKWFTRSDLVGWPLLDMVSAAPSGAQIIQFAIAFGVGGGFTEIRLERVSVDTTRDAAAWPLLTATPNLWIGSTFTFERRRPGLAWIERTAYVNAVSGVIDFGVGRARARLDYSTVLR